jgi:peptidoglycan/LPS O-acetylase OafA/YrhL
MAKAGSGRESRRLVSVDLLRGLAAFFVVLFHAQHFFRRGGPPTFGAGGIYTVWGEPVQQIAAFLLFGLGFLGVSLFFVISGFCIHLPFAARARPLRLASFAKRRFIRLYPAYLAICLVGFALTIVKEGFGQGSATLSNLVGHLFFWHYDYPIEPHGVEFTIVIWTIAIEVHFYLMYALLFRGLVRFGISHAAVLGLIVSLVYRVVWIYGGFQGTEIIALLEPQRFAIARFGEWLLGAWIAEAYASGRIAVLARSGWLGWRGVWLGCGTVLGSALGLASLRSGQYTTDLPSCIGFAWLLASLLSLELSGRFALHGRLGTIAVWLGDRSYSLYLVHYLVISTTGEILARLLSVSDKDAMAGTPVWFGVTILAICISLVAADLMYRAIERPSHSLARRTTRL